MIRKPNPRLLWLSVVATALAALATGEPALVLEAFRGVTEVVYGL